MKKGLILVILLSFALVMAACGNNSAPPANAPATEQTSNTEGVAVNVSDDTTSIAAGTTGLIVNTDGVLIVADGSPASEEVSQGVSITYGQNISLSVAETGATVVASSAISSKQADTLIKNHKEDPISYEDILIETKGRQPLFHGEKESALTKGHGYYFVDNGKVLFVGFDSRETTLVTYLGAYSGATIVVSDAGNVDVKAGNASVSVNSDGGVSINAGDGASVVANPDGSASVKTGDGASVVANPDGSASVKSGDGASVVANPDGSASVKSGDGTKIETNDDGSVDIDVAGGPKISVDEDGNVDLGGLFG